MLVVQEKSEAEKEVEDAEAWKKCTSLARPAGAAEVKSAGSGVGCGNSRG
jgi:hypothetical protein